MHSSSPTTLRRGHGSRKTARFLAQLGVVAGVFLSTAADAAAHRDAAEEKELRILELDNRDAANLIAKSEALAARGDLRGSAAELARATEVADSSALVWRRYCEVLTYYGQKASAIDACRRALKLGGSPSSILASVRALLAPKPHLTSEELAEALVYVGALRQRARSQVQSYAAECELAVALRDWPALRGCTAKLEELFPGHSETRHAVAQLGAVKVPWYVPWSWSALVILFVVLVGRATFRWTAGLLARLRRFRLVVSSICAFLSVAVVTPPVAAELSTVQLSRFPINDQNPEGRIPTDTERNNDPIQFGYFIMDLSERAEKATQRGDHAAAIRYYRALARAVPDRAISFSKLCESYIKANDQKRALASCRAAVSLEGAKLDDFVRYGGLVIASEDALKPEDIAAVGDTVTHLRKEAPETSAAERLECKLALKLRDITRMNDCVNHMSRVAPNDQELLFYQWAFAVMRRDRDAAAAWLGRARAARVPLTQVQRMEEATRATFSPWNRVGGNGWIALGATILGLGVVGGRMLTLRKRAQFPVSAA